MNINEYISSGVIEAYVLGIATDEELLELKKLRLQYPELEIAIQEQELLLGQYGQAQAIAPPPQLKRNIWEAIQANENKASQMDELTQTTPLIPLPTNADVPIKKEKGWQQYGMAASVALLVAVGASNIWMQKNQGKMNAEMAAMSQKQEALLAENKAAIQKVTQAEQALAVLSLPNLKKIKLDGVGTHTDNSAMLYWDGATGNVFVDMHTMPAAPDGKAYQLWAIVDGKPVDAGMYNAKDGANLIQMKTFAKAEMFAVTIEKTGGSPTPTMEQMVVAGKTS